MCAFLSADAQKKLDAARERIAVAGAPANWAQLERDLKIEGKDAVPLCLELTVFIENNETYIELTAIIDSILERNDNELNWADITSGDIGPEDWQRITTAADNESIEAYYARLAQIAECTHHTFHVDENAPFEAIFMNFRLFRTATVMLLLRARIALERNDIDQAVEAFEHTQSINKQLLQGTPVLITALTANALDRHTLDFLEDPSLPQAFFDRLDTDQLLFQSKDYWPQMIDGERCFGQIGFQILLTGNNAQKEQFGDYYFPALPLKILNYNWLNWFLRYDYATYLNYMADLREPAQSYSKDLLANQRWENKKSYERHNRFKPLSNMQIPNMQNIRMSFIRSDASALVVHTAIALNAYAAQHGQYPDDLSQLVPETLTALPIDPFSDQPLIYRAQEAGFALYSVGPNLIDNNGTTNEEGYVALESGDIIWAGRGSILKRPKVVW